MSALPHLSCAALRELDRLAIEELGLPSVVLMENAGRGAAEALLREPWLPSSGAEAEVVIFCGAGNNGGDGFVAARHLSNAGKRVLLVETVQPERLSPDAAVFRGVCAALGLERVDLPGPDQRADLLARIERSRVWVDALLGTGARGEPRAPLDTWIGALDERKRALAAQHRPLLVALDLPSGLDADSGRAARATIRADRTLTFAAPKLGFLAPGAAEFLGAVEVISIGTPASLAWRARATCPA